MKISLHWLSDYIDIKNYSPDVIAKVLTDLGLEVEAIEHIGKLDPNIVVAHVLTEMKHPNADTLHLCTVDDGSGHGPIQVVCGAHNVRQGLKIAFSRVGSTLPDGMKIKEAKLRGEQSCGMICSERELGLSDEHGAILELPLHLKVGQPIQEALQLEDHILTLNVTPNRGDCLGYLGVAQELSAKLKIPLKRPNLSNPESKVQTKNILKLQIENHEDCPRFVALYVKNISPVVSPEWVKRRLEKNGMRGVNLIVDATNYAMLEWGQPNHAYDVRDIAGNKIIVRSANDNELIATLDGKKHQLNSGDILISDEDGPVGLAGVMGGEQSEVKNDTSEIILEVAAFSPSSVRKTSKRLTIHTEASHRFERGINIDVLPQVARRVAHLIFSWSQELKSQGIECKIPEIASDLVEFYPKPTQPSRIALRVKKVQQIIGSRDISANEIKDILSGLNIHLMDQAEDRMLFEVPLSRGDIVREMDLIEEVARHRGYDKIQSELPKMSL